MLQMPTLRREALTVKKINPNDHEISHIHLSLNIDLKEKKYVEIFATFATKMPENLIKKQ